MKNKQSIKSNKGLVKAICGSLLVGIPAITLTSVAMPVAQLNPYQNLFSEAPSNPSSTGLPENTSTPATPVTPPLPEQLQPPSATVVPVEGQVNVTLANQTYTDVNYQVIGETEPRTLAGRSEVTLQGLETPVNITFYRPDRGFLRVSPQSSETGRLTVTLTEATDLSQDTTAMTIQASGNVFLN